MSDPENDDLVARLELVASAFSPSSPITIKELFSGRVAQLNRVWDVLHQNGQHALIYGERGVGKTSLAQVAKDSHGGLSAYYTCNSGDNFASIWRHIFEEISFTIS